jgi:hypothetical protein
MELGNRLQIVTATPPLLPAVLPIAYEDGKVPQPVSTLWTKNAFPAGASDIVISTMRAIWNASSHYSPLRFKEHRRLVPFTWVYSIKYISGGIPIDRTYPSWTVELSHVSNALIRIVLFELHAPRRVVGITALSFIVTYLLHYKQVTFSWISIYRYKTYAES